MRIGIMCVNEGHREKTVQLVNSLGHEAVHEKALEGLTPDQLSETVHQCIFTITEDHQILSEETTHLIEMLILTEIPLHILDAEIEPDGPMGLNAEVIEKALLEASQKSS